MNTNQFIVWIVVATIILGGGYVLLSGPGSSNVVKDDSSMEKGDSTKKDDATMKDKGQTEGSSIVKKEDSMMKDESAMMEKKGSYESYAPEKLALAASGKVVLFFHAGWCPICRPLDAEMKVAVLPEGVHILKIDYDAATELKKKYGVTYQHTFVQVDAQGNPIAKWGDATTLAQVLARIK